MSRPEGIIVSSVTPFTRSGDRVDTTWFPEHLSDLRQAGVDGVLVLGSMGEAASMDLAEMKQMVDLPLLLREELAVVVGTGAASLEEAIVLAGYAAEKGADAILLKPPHTFEDRGPESRLALLQSLLGSLPAGAQALLYYDPERPGGDMTDAILDALLERFADKIVGIKDVAGNAAHLQALMARYPQLGVYTGRDSNLVAGLQSGAAGAFSGMANILPASIVEIREAHRDGVDLEEMAQLMARMEALLADHGTVGAIKALIPLLAGPGMTFPRSPQTLPSMGDLKRLEDRMIEVFNLPDLFHT